MPIQRVLPISLRIGDPVFHFGVVKAIREVTDRAVVVEYEPVAGHAALRGVISQVVRHTRDQILNLNVDNAIRPSA